MVGEVSRRRGAQRPIRRPENNSGMRSSYGQGNMTKKIVTKLINQARRNGVRSSLPSERRVERPIARANNRRMLEKRADLEPPSMKAEPFPRRRIPRRNGVEKLPEASGSKFQEARPVARRRPARPANKRIVLEPDSKLQEERPRARPNFGRRPRRSLELDSSRAQLTGDKERGRPVLKNTVPRREDGRRRERVPIREDKRSERGMNEAPPRMARRSPPHSFPDERRAPPHRHSPPSAHPGAHPFPNMGAPHRMRHEDHHPPLRHNERSPPRVSFPPRMREENRSHREPPMAPMEKGPIFYERFKEPPTRGRMSEPGRLLLPPERDSIMRRNRSPQRNKRESRTEREGELVKRPRNGPSRQLEKNYGPIESSHPRMIPRDIEALHRRPAPDRGPHYSGRGMQSSPIGREYPRTSLTPPALRLMKAIPPRGQIRDMESDYRLIRSGRRDGFPPEREPIHHPFDFGRERVRMEPYALPEFRMRMLPSRRSMEREIERREREWHSPPLHRLAGSLSARGRSAERGSRYNIPNSNYHYDPLSRR